MSKTLVFGASGQLGQSIKFVSEKENFNGLIFPPEEKANVLNKALLAELFEQEKPDYIINCAAYTAVDKAEDEYDLAAKINCEGVKNLAELCAKHSTTFIHTSTDFVFKGDVVKLLTEEDPAEPISVYGQTKLDGEKVLANICSKYFILRTSWLYSEFANNFVKTMRKIGAERDILNIIADQVGTPTYAVDLAACILNIIRGQKTDFGIYHYSNEGVTSWYDFAKAIFELSKINVVVNPIRTVDYPTKAARPPFSVMDKSLIKQKLNIQIPYWRDSLAVCIDKLEKK